MRSQLEFILESAAYDMETKSDRTQAQNNHIPSSTYLETFTNSELDFPRKNALCYCNEALQSLPDGLSILDYGTGPSLHETILTVRKSIAN